MILLIAVLALGQASDASGLTDKPPAARVVDETTPVAVPEPTDLARQFARGNLAFWFVNHAWAILVPALLLFSKTSARLRTLSARIGRRWVLAVAVYAVLYLGLSSLINLPLGWYEGFVRLHAYGLSVETPGKWLGDRFKSLAISMGMAALLTWIPIGILRRAPRTWWVWTGLLCVPYFLALALLMPVFFDPLFNDFGPMKDTELEGEIVRLAGRAGVEGAPVFEVDKSRDTTAVNAYVTGLLGTKRIVVWDTLLNKLDDRQVLFVVGHEVGHYVLNHVVKGILVSSALVLIGLGLVHVIATRLVARFGPRWGFDRLSDVAAVPLLILVGQVVSLGLTPIGYAYGRHMEHEADRFALELTRANHTGGLAFVTLQRENLSIPHPDLFTRICRSTHPSLGDRIDFCNRYHPWREGSPLRYGDLIQGEAKPSP